MADTVKKTVKKATETKSGRRVMEMAEKLSYPKGTPKEKYAYKGGKPTKKFQNALDEVLPNRENWSAPARKGASCDVAVCVVMRKSKVSPKYPRGREEQMKFVPKHCDRYEYKWAVPAKKAKPNDVVFYDRGGGKGHTFIRGEDCWYEARYGKAYFHRRKDGKKFHKKYKRVIILREK